MPTGWLLAMLVTGVVGAIVLGRVPVASAGSALLIAVVAGALLLTKAVVSRSGRWCLIASVGFGLLLALRTDPRLVAFDLLASLLFTMIAVVGPERIFDWRPLQLLGDAVSLVIQPFSMVGRLVPSTDRALVEVRADRSERRLLVIGILQGSVIAVPIIVALAALLGSADVVFADLLGRGQFDAGNVWEASLRFSVGAGAVLVLIGRTLQSRSEVLPSGLALDRVPTLVVLAALDAIFALFVAAQLYALTSAGDRILADAGLTYSDYARQGFFQLLWVAGLTMVVLLSLRSVASGWCRGDRWFRWTGLAAVVLTIGVVAVAIGRLQLYIADEGLTPLRFYSSVFSVWVAMGFAIVAVRLVGWRAERAWALPALVLSGIVVLVGLNVANPEARIADDLVPRPGLVSATHLLTADGRRVVAERFDEIDPAWADEVERQLCDDVPEDDGWLSWNLGRSRARSALLELC